MVDTALPHRIWCATEPSESGSKKCKKSETLSKQLSANRLCKMMQSMSWIALTSRSFMAGLILFRSVALPDLAIAERTSQGS